RAQQIQWYLTQPFYVAEAWTNRPGSTVARDVAAADIRQLLDGKEIDLGKDELSMTGSLADSVERPH
ncbi:MAG: F0F1 ATP synthase subunit beta, partial [Thermomicrobiales bacterium]